MARNELDSALLIGRLDWWFGGWGPGFPVGFYKDHRVQIPKQCKPPMKGCLIHGMARSCSPVLRVFEPLGFPWQLVS